MGLYTANRFWLKRVVTLPIAGYFLRCHLNDLLGGVVFTALINIILCHSKYSRLRINGIMQAMTIMFAVGLAWEYILPCVYPRGTADPLDLLAYMAGGMLYVLLCRLIEKLNTC